jgi:hypothetical protein
MVACGLMRAVLERRLTRLGEMAARQGDGADAGVHLQRISSEVTFDG